MNTKGLWLACWLALFTATGGSASAAGKHACSGGGFWFPAEKAKLAKDLDGYLAEKPAQPIENRPAGIIAPHAGYQFSGPAAGAAFAALKGQSYDRVIVLGFSHRSFIRNASILDVEAYSTPLGDIPVDTGVTGELLKNDLFRSQPYAHAREHSLENELPFLQRALPEGWKLVPILIGQAGQTETEITEASMKLYGEIADALRPFVDDKTLVVASSDFTHYGANYGYLPFGNRPIPSGELKRKLRELDFEAIYPALKLDAEAFRRKVNDKKITICGRRPICVLLQLLPKSATGHVAEYTTSGEITGDWSSSVSYASIVFTTPVAAQVEETTSEAGRKQLLDIARKAIEAHLNGKPVPDFGVASEELQRQRGVFVTLNKAGRLRGCIGCFTSKEPLHKIVSEYAVISATRDRRFAAVKASELEDIRIEISILSPMRRVKDPLKEVTLGVHGIYIKRGYNSGTYLPQVATEHNMTKEEFLSSCSSQKAGLSRDAWKDPRTEVYVYTAEVFHEDE